MAGFNLLAIRGLRFSTDLFMKDLASVYREKSPCFGSKATLAAVQFGIVLVVLWLVFGGGIAVVDRSFGAAHHTGSFVRRAALGMATALYFFRILATLFIFLKRRMSWSEAGTIALSVSTIEVLFAYLGGRNPASFGILGVIAACLVVLGSLLNSGSEWQRYRWKRRPENKGHLFTNGLFQYSRHINYFGDVILFTGWALMTGRLALWVIPALMSAGFVFVNVPAQDRYLAERYGEEYRSYANSTARLIPYIY
jgi:protein-S-isoprenylcysteine O-methyltransferase Ste14